MIFPFETYTESVENCFAILEEAGIKKHKVKNYWQEGDNYQVSK